MNKKHTQHILDTKKPVTLVLLVFKFGADGGT